MVAVGHGVGGGVCEYDVGAEVVAVVAVVVGVGGGRVRKGEKSFLCRVRVLWCGRGRRRRGR